MLRPFCAAISLCLLAATPATAATTVFPTVIYFSNQSQGFGLIGASPPLTTLTAGAFTLIGFGTDISGFDILFDVSAAAPGPSVIVATPFRANASGTLFIRASGVGLVDPNGDPATAFIAETVGPGVIRLPGAAFRASCISLGGCNGFSLEIPSGASAAYPFGSPASSVTFAGIAAATPEPSAWAFMMVSFMLVAARLKRVRRERSKAAVPDHAVFARR